jgi:hypothetical protein
LHWASVPFEFISWDFNKPEPTYKALTNRSLAGALSVDGMCAVPSV